MGHIRPLRAPPTLPCTPHAIYLGLQPPFAVPRWPPCSCRPK